MKASLAVQEEHRQEGTETVDQAEAPDNGGFATDLQTWQSGQVPYRDCGFVAPQRRHGTGRGWPRRWRGCTGEWGHRALGRLGAGAEAQRPVADALQEGTGTGGYSALREFPPGTCQLQPHTAQHIQRATVMA